MSKNCQSISKTPVTVSQGLHSNQTQWKTNKPSCHKDFKYILMSEQDDLQGGQRPRGRADLEFKEDDTHQDNNEQQPRGAGTDWQTM